MRIYRSVDDADGRGVGRGDHDDPAAHDIVLRLSIPGQQPLPAVQQRSEEIERALRAALPGLAHVLIEMEPAVR